MTTSILPNKMKRLEQTEIGLLPVEWDVSSLDAVSEKIQDGTHFSPKLGGGEFLYVTSKNIGPGYLKLDSAERISEKEHRAIYRRCDTSFGDIWLTKDGVNTGNAAINTLEEEVSLLSSVAFIRVNPRVYSANFCLQYLLSDSCKRVIAQAVSGML